MASVLVDVAGEAAHLAACSYAVDFGPEHVLAVVLGLFRFDHFDEDLDGVSPQVVRHDNVLCLGRRTAGGRPVGCCACGWKDGWF